MLYEKSGDMLAPSTALSWAFTRSTSTFLPAYAKTRTQEKETEEERWEPYGGAYTQDSFIDLAERV